MNEKSNNPNPADADFARQLDALAEKTNPDPRFANELERQLKAAHKPRTLWWAPRSHSVLPSLGWAALAVILTFALMWSIQNLIPKPQPGTNQTPAGFICPVTEPNGDTPPSEQPSAYHYGNGKIWTDLWPNGRVVMTPENRDANDFYTMKWVWWRNAPGMMDIFGRRLDGLDEPMKVSYSGGYDESAGVYVVAFSFPSTGCWEVTANSGEDSLTFVTEVVFEESTPVPDTTVATPDPNRPGYDFRGAKLTLDVELPASPATANVYSLPAPKPAGPEFTLALAKQYGIHGELYTAKREYPPATGYMVTDGKQQLTAFYENDYTYIADMVKFNRNYAGFKKDDAESIIGEYLQGIGLDLDYRLVQSDINSGYLLQQVSPEGLSMQFESFSQPALRITLDEDGTILSVTAMLMQYPPEPLGTYEIISAEEALQNLLDDTLVGGKLESGYSVPNPDIIPPQNWFHDYPDNETITIVGNVTSNLAADPAKPAAVFVDGIFAVGNTAGMEALNNYTFVLATGQFSVVNGIRKFTVESWDASLPFTNVMGYARKEGDQVIVVNGSDNTEYPLVDPPADIPLNTAYPESSFMSNGMVVDGQFYWVSLQYFADASQMGGGGGGGGGMGFYQLNLSGPIIPFPTPTPAGQGYTQAELAGFLRYSVQNGDTLQQIASKFNITAEEIMAVNYMTEPSIWVGQQLTIPGVPGPTRLDGEHGTVNVTVYEKPNGKRRTVYTFLSEKDQSYYQLTGNNLEPLQEIANRPIALWGKINIDETGMVSVDMEKFENLYPDLQFEELNGKQESIEIDGLVVILLTTADTTYIQMVPNGGYPDGSYYPDTDEVLVEALKVPGETFAGYPAIRVFRAVPAFDPSTSQRMELPRLADTIEVLPDPFGNADTYITPDVTIDKVELVYFATNSLYAYDTPDAALKDSYIQPAWHFIGHYSTGDVIDVLVQALRMKYLSPEPSLGNPPG